jgi:hypothetical protein
MPHTELITLLAEIRKLNLEIDSEIAHGNANKAFFLFRELQIKVRKTLVLLDRYRVLDDTERKAA